MPSATQGSSSADKILDTHHESLYQKPEKAQTYMEFAFQLSLRTNDLWEQLNLRGTAHERNIYKGLEIPSQAGKEKSKLRNSCDHACACAIPCLSETMHFPMQLSQVMLFNSPAHKLAPESVFSASCISVVVTRNISAAEHHLHILCKSFVTAAYHICSTIYLELCAKVEQDASLDIWPELQSRFERVKYFFRLLGKQPFCKKDVSHWIKEYVDDKKANYHQPELVEVLVVAFRSQVCLFHSPAEIEHCMIATDMLSVL